MRKNLFTLLGIAISCIIGYSQPANIALNANSTQSGGGSGDSGPQNYNDGFINEDIGGITGDIYGIVNTGGWIEYTWDTPRTFQDIIFYYGQRYSGKLSHMEVQVFDSSLSSYVTIFEFSAGLGGGGDVSVDTLKLPYRLTTASVRFNNLRDDINGGDPSFREIEVYEPEIHTNDAGITEIELIPASCPGTYPVYASLRNDGSALLNSAVIYWSVDGVVQPYVSYNGNPIDTIGGAGDFETSVYLGDFTFTSEGQVVKVWSTEPNESADTANTNDTLTAVFTLPAPSGLSVSSLTSTSASISWNVISSTSYEIIYGTSGFDPASEGNRVSSLASSPYNLTGLSENTVYEVYIVANCSGGNSDTTEPISFVTTCDPADILSGTYTINADLPTGGTNYASFVELSNDLNSCGISGPVTVNISPGRYKDHLHLFNVRGLSQSNTLTFNGSGADTLVWDSISPKATVILLGTKHTTLKNMTIVNGASSDAWGVFITHNSDSVTVDNCNIYMSTSSISSDRSAIAVSADFSSASTAGANVDYLTVRNCNFTGGYYVLSLTGDGTDNMRSGYRILNNTFTDFRYSGIRGSYLKGLEISGNTVNSLSSYTLTNGIYFTYINNFVIEGNYIYNIPDYGMYLSYLNQDHSPITNSHVVNNMVSSTGDAGIRLSGFQNVDIFHNSVKGEPAIYINDPVNSDIRNNIFYSRDDYALESLDEFADGNNVVDYNIYHTLFGDIASINRNEYPSLNDWKAADAAQNLNSIQGDPLFVSDTDLRPLGQRAHDAGDNSVGVSTDIDGDTRPRAGSSAVDIGADEYDLPACPGIENYSISDLDGTSVTIAIDGTSGNYDVEVGMCGFTRGNGSFTVSGASPLIVNGLSPLTCYEFYLRRNCGTDSSAWAGPVSFTTECLESDKLSGTYTIDSSQATGGTNYNSFADALADLSSCGVSGPVVFNVVEGTYEEQVVVGNIPGTSETNRLVFQNAPSNTVPAEIVYGNGGFSGNYVWRFNGASYVTLRGLTITTTSTSSYRRVLEIAGTSRYIVVENNILNGDSGPTSTSNNRAVIMNDGGDDNEVTHTIIRHNRINGGSYGIYWQGMSSSEYETNNIIDSNIIDQFYQYGIYAYYQDMFSVTGNIVTSASPSSTSYGIRHYYNSHLRSIGNKIVIRGTSTIYGMYVGYVDGEENTPSVVANNMISVLDNTSSAYGIYMTNTSQMDVLFNSVLVNAGSASGGRSLYVSGSENADIRILSNSFVNTGGGVAADIASSATEMISEMDYNNYYSTGTLIGKWGDISAPTFSYWQSNMLVDVNSLNINPMYNGDEDLHASSILLNNKGAVVSSVSRDFDGDPRSGSAPDIGADEFAFTMGGCSAFTGFLADSVTNSRIKIDWAPGSGGSSFKLEYGPRGFSRGNGTIVSGTYPGIQPPVYITGLSGKTKYDLYFSEYCNAGTDSSAFEKRISFETKSNCPPVYLPEVIHLSGDSIALSFVADDDQSFQFEYGPSGYGQGTGTIVNVENPGGIGGLQPLTEYDIYVRNRCEGTGSSPWVGPVTVITGCEYTLSGGYTVNANLPTAGRNFKNFADLILQMEICGVSGPVTINVASGIYNEQVRFTNFPGMSESAPVIIQADPANSAPAEIRYEIASSSGENWVWLFEDASNVTLRGLTLTTVDPTGNSNDNYVMEFKGQNDNILIKENILSTNALPSSASIRKCVIYSSTNALSHSAFRNNNIQGGSYGMYFIDGSSELGANIVIEGNTIEDFFHYGVYMRDVDSVFLSGNTLTSNIAATEPDLHGMYLTGASNLKITGNKLILKGSVDAANIYGIRLVFCNAVSYNPNLIANNMISMLDNTGNAVGIFSENTPFTDIVHNSVLVNSGSVTGSYPLYSNENLFDYGVRILNNSFVNTGGGPAAKVYYQNLGLRVKVMDYNNYFTTGATLIEAGNVPLHLPDLASWTATQEKDVNSISVDPLYFSNEDLHAQEAVLYNAALPFPSVNTDYDRDVRSQEAPSVGADEFLPAICLPSTGLAAYGIFSDSINLNWEPGTGTEFHIEYGPSGFEPGTGTRISGIADSAYTINGLTPRTEYDIYLRDYCESGSSGDGDSSIWKGPVSVRTLCTGFLSGAYTINKANPTDGTNFASFAEAASALADCGISGPVVFNIASGTYHENVEFTEISGASAANTVVFQPDPSNSQPVLLEHAISGERDNFAIRIHSTDYLTIRGLTINVHGSSYGRVIEFKGESEYITIEENILSGVTSTGNSNKEAVITKANTASDVLRYSTIRNNEINDGSYGIYWYGSEEGGLEPGNVIDSNTINGFYSTGIYLLNQSGIKINGNYIESAARYDEYLYGIRMMDNSVFECIGNIVIARGTGSNQGIYVSESHGSSGQRSLLANNMVSALDNINNSRGIYSFSNDFLDIVHNSVLVNAGAVGKSSALYVSSYKTGGDSIRILNNNLVNTGYGYAVYISEGNTNILEMDHNNYYTNGLDLGYYDGGVSSSMSSWQARSGFDMNSRNADPDYVSDTDLHTLSAALNGGAIPYDRITTDIDSEGRSATTPDIGADEFTASYCKELAITAKLHIIDVFHNKATAVWNGEAGTTYDLEYGLAGFEKGSGMLSRNMVDSLKLLSNLTPETTYDVYLRYKCGSVNDSSLWIGPVSFRTSCTPISAFPWTEDFETSGNQVPACWANEANDDDDWVFASGGISDHTTGTNTGYYASVDDDHESPEDTLNNLLTPIFDLNSLLRPQLSFWYYIDNATETSVLFIDVYDGNTWHMGADTIVYTAQMWLKDSLSLLSYVSGETRIRFRAEETADVVSNIYIDDVMIFETPISCVDAPYALAADVNCTSAELSWASASNIDNSVVEYGASGFTPGTGNSLMYVGSPQTIGNLVPGTSYDFYVYDTCSAGGTTDTIGPLTFTTLISPSARFTFTTGAATATKMDVSFDASASEGASTYSWDFGDGSPTGSGETTDHDYTSNGSFIVVLTIDGNCGAATYTDTINIEGIDVEENFLKRSLRLYPNPTRGEVQLSFETEGSGAVNITVLDLSGKPVIRNTLTNANGSHSGKLDLSHLAAGIYIIKISSENMRAVRRIVKQ